MKIANDFGDEVTRLMNHNRAETQSHARQVNEFFLPSDTHAAI